jgi:hypothetical protein
MRFRLPAAALLIALTSPAQAEQPTVTRLSYAVYAAGLNVLNFEARVDLDPGAYRIDMRFRTAGMFGFLFPAQTDSYAHGTWDGVRPTPAAYVSRGTVRGKDRRVGLDFTGGQATVRELLPSAQDDDHLAVPPGATRDSMDTLSGLAFVIRSLARTGRCDGQARLFDGRRVLEVTSTTIGRETLAREDGTLFAGPATRCDLAGRVTAGFLKDDNEEERKRIHDSQAWLAEILPGHPPLPVRIIFETRFFGHATAYLTAASPAK